MRKTVDIRGLICNTDLVARDRVERNERRKEGEDEDSNFEEQLP
jgi:hypothetical protein